MNPRNCTAAIRILPLALFVTVGCIRTAPKMPSNLASAAPIVYTSDEFKKDVGAYHTALDAKDLDAAKSLRNQIVFRVTAQVDAAYGKFEGQLTNGRATYGTGGDAAQLGLTAASTVVGASGVKDILDATSIALQGTRISFDKNFFEQKTTEALVSQMRATRKTQQAAMLTSLANRDVTSYPLEAAWIDVVSYYYAGTIPSALVDIASKAGTDATVAQTALNSAKAITSFTPAQAKQAISIRATYQKLSTAITSGDAATTANAVSTLKSILTKASVTFAADATPTDLLAALKTAMAAAADDTTKLQELNNAVQAAN